MGESCQLNACVAECYGRRGEMVPWSYVFGEVRVATLALLTLTALSGRCSSGVVITKFPDHAVTFRSSPTVCADTPRFASASTRILSGKPPRAMWSAAVLLGLYRIRASLTARRAYHFSTRRTTCRRFSRGVSQFNGLVVKWFSSSDHRSHVRVAPPGAEMMSRRSGCISSMVGSTLVMSSEQPAQHAMEESRAARVWVRLFNVHRDIITKRPQCL